MKKIPLILAVTLAAAISVTVSGCSIFDTSKPSPSPLAPSPSAATASTAPSVQPSIEPTPEESPSPDVPAVSFAPPVGGDADPTIDPNDYFAMGDALMQTDGIGSVRLNMTETEILELMGQPDSKSEPEIWGADGLEHATWSYDGAGLLINMAKDPSQETSIVFTLDAQAPCTLATQRGIKIGDTKDAVLTAYAEAIDPMENAETDTSIVIGTIYGGIIVGIEDGVVTSIFFGAGAE